MRAEVHATGRVAVEADDGRQEAPASAPAPAVRAVAVETWRVDGTPATAGTRTVPVEVPVAVAYRTDQGEVPYAVMMATPADLEDFAVGFSRTEGLVAGLGDVAGVAVHGGVDAATVSITLAPGVSPAALHRTRSSAGRTGCGVCGVTTPDALPRAAVVARPPVPLSLAAVARALAALEERQPLHQATRAVHAAAWCTAHGDVLVVREDVGRHNALDKCIGALLRGAMHPDHGFLVITSRCSYEMVEKAAACGAGALVAVSAPTALAIETAARHDITLLAVARRDAVQLFHGTGRVRP